jgi:hypothetical protein
VRTRLVGLLVLLLTAAALSVPQQPSLAAHKWQQLMLSRNGHHWKPDLRMPLFKRAVVLVPGQERRRTFYVRNQSESAARLGVTVRVTGSKGLIERPRFWMAVRIRHGRWQRISHTGRNKVAHVRVVKGRMVPVTVRVRLMPRALNRTMDDHCRFVTRVRLTSLKKR